MLTHCIHSRPVFRTREIVRWTKILGSLNWITDPDPDPALFVGGFHVSRCQQKISVFLLNCTHIYISLQSHKEAKKTVEIKILLNFFWFVDNLTEGSGSGSVKITTDRVPGGQKPTDPDPDHCFKTTGHSYL
jgi:hypothetical protein